VPGVAENLQVSQEGQNPHRSYGIRDNDREIDFPKTNNTQSADKYESRGNLEHFERKVKKMKTEKMK
jgi:hypothetical protein